MEGVFLRDTFHMVKSVIDLEIFYNLLHFKINANTYMFHEVDNNLTCMISNGLFIYFTIIIFFKQRFSR